MRTGVGTVTLFVLYVLYLSPSYYFHFYSICGDTETDPYDYQKLHVFVQASGRVTVSTLYWSGDHPCQ